MVPKTTKQAMQALDDLAIAAPEFAESVMLQEYGSMRWGFKSQHLRVGRGLANRRVYAMKNIFSATSLRNASKMWIHGMGQNMGNISYSALGQKLTTAQLNWQGHCSGVLAPPTRSKQRVGASLSGSHLSSRAGLLVVPQHQLLGIWR